MTESSRVVFRPSRPPIDWATYLALPWPLPADPVSTALKVGQHHIKVFGSRAGVDPESGADSFSMGAAMLAALARLEAPLDASRAEINGGESEARVGDFLIKEAAGVTPPGLEVGAKSMAYLIGSLSAQLLAQEAPAHKQLLVMNLLGWTAAEGSSEIPIDIGAETEAVRGALQTASMLAARGAVSPYFNEPEALHGLRATRLSPQVAKMYLDRIRLEVTSVRQTALGALAGSVGLDTRVAAFWIGHPLVHVGSGHHVIAPSGFVIDAFLTGLLLRLLDDERKRTGKDGGPISRQFGTRFEQYVGGILREAATSSHVEAERIFHEEPGRSFKSPDYVVWSPDREVDVLAMECKLRGIPAGMFAGQDLAHYEEAMREGFIPAVIQVLKALWRMKWAVRAGRVLADADLLCRTVDRAERITVAIVLPQFPTPLNAGQLFERSDPDVLAQLQQAEAKAPNLRGMTAWVADGVAQDRMHWIWIGAGDLENHAGWIGAQPIVPLLRDFAWQARRRSIIDVDRPGFAATLADRMRAMGCTGQLRPTAREMTRAFWERLRWSVYGA